MRCRVSLYCGTRVDRSAGAEGPVSGAPEPDGVVGEVAGGVVGGETGGCVAGAIGVGRDGGAGGVFAVPTGVCGASPVGRPRSRRAQSGPWLIACRAARTPV